MAQQIGVGGEGRVYAGVDTQQGKPVALKITSSDDSLSRTRFRREAHIGVLLGQALNSVVRCLGWGTLPDRGLYIVMDLVERAQRLDLDSGLLSARLDWLERVAAVVAKVHALGVVHRDLKPSNLLVNGDGQLFLSDFGFAKHVGPWDPASEAEEVTKRNAALGTPAYMSLEQFQNARDVDFRADVFSLGAMLFRVLTGKSPYSGDSMQVFAEQLRVRHTSQPAPRPRDHDPRVSPALDDFCVHATHPEAQRRVASAQEFLEGLRRARRKASWTPQVSSKEGVAVTLPGGREQTVPLKAPLSSLPGRRRFLIRLAGARAELSLPAEDSTHTQRESLRREAGAVAQLTHPHVVRSLGRVEGGLVLEALRGLPAPMPASLALNLGLDLLAGLTHLHAHEFAHCALGSHALGIRGGEGGIHALAVWVQRGGARGVLRRLDSLRAIDSLGGAGGADSSGPLRGAAEDVSAAGRLLGAMVNGGAALKAPPAQLPPTVRGRFYDLVSEMNAQESDDRPSADEAWEILRHITIAERRAEVLRQSVVTEG